MNRNISELLFKYLPLRISHALNLLPDDIASTADEIRIRAKGPISVTSRGRNITFTQNGMPCNIENALCATRSELEECVLKLTNGSLYTCDEYIAEGFIPLSGGGRAGVCGRAVFRNGRMSGFSEIYSVSIRIHRFIPDTAAELINELCTGGLRGTLVCSPPALGKTTYLRSAAYLLANGRGIRPVRVGIADERCEISPSIPEKGLCDIITSMPKAQAITLLTRTMAPEVIICDEISEADALPVTEAQNTGVFLIASAHCAHPRDLKSRGNMSKLLSSGIFPLCVLLGFNGKYTSTLCRTEDIL